MLLKYLENASGVKNVTVIWLYSNVNEWLPKFEFSYTLMLLSFVIGSNSNFFDQSQATNNAGIYTNTAHEDLL